MFLNQLTQVEKEAFIALAIISAESNGEVTAEEQIVIDAYCREMEIDSDKIVSKTIQEIIKTFSDSPDQHKNIIILETLGLLYADGSIDEKEQSMLKELSNGIGVSNTKVAELKRAMEKYVKVTEEIIASIE